MKSLVVVESPAKAKTINKILGKDYEVFASIGHIKDLPENELGVDVENNFTPKYIIIPGKEKIVKELKKNAKNKKAIFLATDPDREGEAIAWHIAEEVKDGIPVYRVTFNEITEKAVKEAFKNPGSLDINKVEAQQARRILDRLVGYSLSPLLWKKVKRGLSAGRVQSVALRLVVEREREIEAFKPEEYWTIEGIFDTGDSENPVSITAKLYRYKDRLVIERAKDGKTNFLLKDKATADALIEELRAKNYILAEQERKKRKRNPPPPFITSTLQQEAAKRLGFTAKKTMLIAQQLYEGIEIPDEGSIGLITYMRTDSVRVSPEAQQWARKYIEENFGKDYLPPEPPHYKSKKGAQEAHEAIRPTYVEKTPEKVKKFLSKDHYALYKLIWDRFIASQMAPAQLESTTYIIRDIDDSAEFRTTGTVIKFPGFLRAGSEEQITNDDSEEDLQLPDIPEGKGLNLSELKGSQHFTQPPPRYTEATLVKTLEERGIGRPSTYATILSTIQERKYVTKVDGRFIPSELGILVNDLLVERFPELIDVGFTAKMEEELDEIEEGRLKWLKVVKDFYGPFKKDLDEALKNLQKIKPQDIPTDILCEKCGLPMVIRWGRHGRFIACTGYPKCKNTRALEENRVQEKGEAAGTGEMCDKCGSPMIIKRSRYGKFLACSRYPECKNTKPISSGIKCPLDDGELIERRTKKGRTFWSCSHYPECKFATWHRPVSEPCPDCGASFLVIKNQNSKKILQCINENCKFQKDITSEEKQKLKESPAGKQ
ncbi:MAG: type I DNA topoisomerase [Thermodesulfovibrionales bacterium]|nr:type I DNA topoisomerase [Thermodesulfovibrionales bacterium]